MQTAINCRDLCFSYHDGSAALRGVSMQVTTGERVAIVGPNGAGKSTFLLHLNGILQRASGLLEVCGREVSKANIGEIRARVGMVFQHADDQLFMPTVFDDVAFGPLNSGLPAVEVRRRVAEALEQVGLAGFESRAPYHLSGGEKKSVAIATVLSMSPEVLVMDEPTSNLDHRARRRLIRLLQSLRQTLVIATHDLRMVQEVCGRVIVLDGGAVMADGPTAALLGDSELLEQHGLEAI